MPCVCNRFSRYCYVVSARRLLLQPRVPEEWPRHRDVAVELGRARGEAVEISDLDVRHFGEDDRLNIAPERAALLRIGLGVERRKRGLLSGRAPPARRALAELWRGQRGLGQHRGMRDVDVPERGI